MDPRLRLVLFTLDESTYARELAPLAGVYPSLRLGPPWWFHDSFEGMRRFRELATETAGFYNTAGFNDDTRALCSIPARHDVARRCDCAFLAELVVTHRLDETEAFVLAPLLATGLARESLQIGGPHGAWCLGARLRGHGEASWADVELMSETMVAGTGFEPVTFRL